MTRTTLGTPGIEYKSVETQARPFEVNDLGDGMIEAIVSVTNVKDNVNDIILPGAFTKSLEKRTPKGVWHHSWTDPIAKTHEIKELMPGDPLLPSTLPNGRRWPKDAGALYVKMEFNLNTDKGRNAYEDVKFFGDSQEWSIGYKVPEKKAFRRGGTRHIQELELYEYSPVLFGAMPSARTATVKDAQLAYKSLMQGEEVMAPDITEMKAAMASFAEQFHELVESFAAFVGEGEEKSDEDSRDEALSIAEDLGLDPEDFEAFYDAIDAENADEAQVKAEALMDVLEGKSGIRTIALYESIGVELKALETKPPRPKGQRPDWDDEEDDEEDYDDFDDDQEDEDLEDGEDDDDDDDDEKHGRKDDFGDIEMKSMPIEDIERYLL